MGLRILTKLDRFYVSKEGGTHEGNVIIHYDIKSNCGISNHCLVSF
jgi:hypothetical protein